MRFHADLHVHSKHSRATSRDLDLEHLAWWAARKGIGVVGTGDFVHPAWRAELKEKLVPAEPGLFRLRPDIEAEVERTLPAICRRPVRFMLSVEISTIYKKGEKTRKIHHLIYAPDFATADRLADRLARIGNIASDGRPILGLDSRNLLEIALDTGPGAYLVPAHVWTPWFAALGAQGGFDSIAECYGDLTDHIFAVETGLSSDPAMNWRVSFLDRYRLTSNSDAHSPGKLGREATVFDCEPDYFAIRRALESGDGYVGTVEFFPEEGKYHLDGHRRCRMRLDPRETIAHGGRCPVCGEAVTIGVAHRVEALADRTEAEALPPPSAGEIASLVPLPEVISEIVGTGPGSKAVMQRCDRLVAALGPELSILGEAPVEDIARADTLLGEAVGRLRAGRVIREAGYDGEYGVIRLFEERELRGLTAGGLLFEAPARRQRKVEPPQPTVASAPASAAAAEPAPPAHGGGILAALDDDQRAAAAIVEGPLLVVAGPGSGKTRALTHRIAHLVADRGVPASRCLAITFTRRAAAEMRERLAVLLPAGAGEVAIHTFHSLGLEMLREIGEAAGLPSGFRLASEAERLGLVAEAFALSERKAERLLALISRLKRTRGAAEPELADRAAAYARLMAARGWIDFDDLVGLAVDALDRDPALADAWRRRFSHVSVDEFQDLDEQQYRLMRLLVPAGGSVAVIGDPDQAIYGFRGADAACFDRFARDFPETATVRLRRNYRSTGTIVSAASQVIAAGGREAPLAELVREMRERVTIHAAPTERAEAEFVVAAIERLIGGHSFFSIDSGRTANGQGDLAFADIAVLYRTEAQAAALVEALARSGMPFKRGSPAPIAADPAVRALLAASEGAGGPLAEAVAEAAGRLADSGEGLDASALAEARRWLTTLAESAGEDRARFLEAVAMASEADFWDARADRVSLLTMHAAKGLEFRAVFVVGLEEGLMPLTWGARDPAAEAEERRLLYVAMTRAMDRLFLTRALERTWRGRTERRGPSPFLAAIEAELVEIERRDLAPPRPADRQLSLF